jgi:Domain of unknown function (DUF4406)
MKLYIAGPMSGIKEYNYPAFMQAEKELQAKGFETENPATDGQVEGWIWTDYMRRGLVQLLKCEGVALLPEWYLSKGATIERNLAATLDMPVAMIETWLTSDG